MPDPPSPSLPPELWVYIIRLAAPFFIVSDYIPFEEQRIPQHNDVLREKCTLALVCKSWNRMVSLMLAEDIRFVRPREPYLESFVFGSPTVEPRGHHTRRLQLAYSYIPGLGGRIDSIASLLSSCPNVECLHRPYPSTEYPTHHPSFTNIPQLQNLTRVDWFCVAHGTNHNDPTYTATALHSLVDIVNHSPNLRYLSISGKGSSWPVVPLAHPNIQTLRVGSLPGNLDVCIAEWRFPLLSHLILEHLPTECIRIFSQQVHTVEFAPRLFLRRDESILLLNLNAKPKIRRINFSILFFPQARSWHGKYRHVREIGLDLRLTEVFGQQGQRSLWTTIKGQFSWLSSCEGHGFVNVDLVELHGDWSRWEEEEEFSNFKVMLKAKGTKLRYLRD